MVKSNEVKRIEEYLRDGYLVMQFDPEECHYEDSDTHESGERVVIHIVMDKPSKR